MTRTIAATLALAAFTVVSSSPADASVQSDVNSLTGNLHTRVAWREGGDQVSGGSNIIKGFDSVTGQIHTIWSGACIKSVLASGGHKLLVTSGDYKVYVVNWDGSGKTFLNNGSVSDGWRDPSDGSEWAVYRASGNSTGGGVYRCRIDNPSTKVLITDRPEGHAVYPWLQMSQDGTKAASFFPWSTGGVLTIATNNFESVTSGCWSGMSSDNSKKWFHLTGDHKHLSTFNLTTKITDVDVMPPISPAGQVYCPRAAEGPTHGGRFFVICGGYPAYNTNGDTVEVFLGKFNSGFTGVDGWARVTNNSVPDQHPTVWIGVEGTPSVTVDSFGASPSTISQGASTTLSWQTSNATSVSIDNGVGTVSADGSQSVSPSTTTTYTLTAQGQGGPVTAQVTVTVNVPQVSVDSFSASPTSIAAGDSATLSWQTSNATSVAIDNGVGTVSADGSQSVSPSSTTTYTLTAQGAGGPETAQVTITVTQPSVTIDSFTASPLSIVSGDSATLSWQTSNATSVAIDNGVGTVSADGSQSVSPTTTTTYTLTAQGVGGPKTAQVTVTVAPPDEVTVDAFDAAPSTIVAGASSTLSWQTSNATSVAIDNGVGTVSVDGSQSVSPSATTTYTLTAQGPGGPRTALVTVTVDVPQVAVDSFTATPSSILTGDATTLAWQTSNATSVTIDNGVGTVSVDGSQSVSPSQTTTYTITADGPGGPITATVTVTVSDPGALHLKFDCGGEPVSGWQDVTPYVSDGSNYTSLPVPDTTGVADAAPADLYRTCRHQGHSYDFPAALVPDGDYVVRLHLNNNAATRAMTWVMEGAAVLSEFDPPVQTATVKSFDVTVSGGLQIEASGSGTWGDVFECGIEVIAGATPPPTPVLTTITVDPADATIALDGTQVLTASTLDQNGDPIAATVTWTASGGSVAPTTGATTTFTPDDAGTFTVTALSGGVSGTSTVTALSGPSITVIEPEGGEVWYVGTTPRIRWSTVNLDNVNLLYSTGGSSGTVELIEASIFDSDARWGNYAWTVPDTPSADCVLTITGYFGEAPETSGVFEIRAVTDTDGDGMDDGWETDHFGDLSHDGSADGDGDGESDYDEFISVTDPGVADGTTPDPAALAFACVPGDAGAHAFAAFAILVVALLTLRLRRAEG